MERRITIAARAVTSLVASLALGACNASDLVTGIGDVDNTDFIVTEAFQFSVAVSTQTEFRLAGINGDMRIIADPTATAITVSGERRVGSSSTADARAHLPQLIVVRTEQPENNRGRAYVVRYDVTLPASLRQAIGNTNGNVFIEGARADLTVGTVNGNVDLVDVTGAVTVGLVNGNVVADVTLPRGSDARLGTVNGNLTLAVQPDASADVSAAWVNGGFTTDGLDLQLIDVGPTSVRGRLGDGAGVIELGTTNGQIRLQSRF
jgi:hypothetical protein